jgi:hypothetical protein
MIDKLDDLEANILQAVINVDKAGLQQAAHTVSSLSVNFFGYLTHYSRPF